MKRSAKILLGVLTIWPIVYIFLFIGVIIGFMAYSSNLPPGTAIGPSAFSVFAVFLLHFFTIVLMLALSIFYLIHAIKNDELKTDMKALWAVLFFVFGIIAEPVYWYIHIWKAPELETRPGQLGAANTSTWDFESGGNRQRDYHPPAEPPDWR